jgi:hypothetical protein
MEDEGEQTQPIISEEEDILASTSVCATPEEQERLLKLFQLFIEIDKNLKKKHEDNKRGTDRTCKAE